MLFLVWFTFGWILQFSFSVLWQLHFFLMQNWRKQNWQRLLKEMHIICIALKFNVQVIELRVPSFPSLYVPLPSFPFPFFLIKWNYIKNLSLPRVLGHILPWKPMILWKYMRLSLRPYVTVFYLVFISDLFLLCNASSLDAANTFSTADMSLGS